jgi:hypothetical protein
MTFASWYAFPFVGIAASERFKFFQTNNSGVLSSTIGVNRVPNLDKTPVVPPTTYVSTMAPMTSTGAQRGAEFLVPYYQPLKYITPFRDTSAVEGATTPDGYTRIMVAPAPTQFLECYYSLGPDIRATCYMQTPSVEIRPAYFTAGWMGA